MSTLKVNTIQNTNGGSSSTPEQIEQGRAKAWVNFDGKFDASNSTPTNTFTTGNGIRDSFNVESVTDRGSGLYTVNFDNAMSDTNYCVLTSGSQQLDSVGNPDLVIAHTHTTSSVKLETYQTNTTQPNDLAIVCLAIFV